MQDPAISLPSKRVTMRNLRMMDLRMMETPRQSGVLMTKLSGRV